MADVEAKQSQRRSARAERLKGRVAKPATLA